MHPLTNEGLKLLRELQAMHAKVIEFTLSSKSVLAKAAMSDTELADLGFVAKRLAELGDDVRKECDNVQATAGKVICVIWITKNQNSPRIQESIRGEFGRAIPKVTQGARIPSRETPEYLALMKHFGFGEDAVACDAVRVHWPGMCEMLARLASEGKPLPPGIDPMATYPVYKAQFLQVKDSSLEPRADKAEASNMKDTSNGEENTTARTGNRKALSARRDREAGVPGRPEDRRGRRA